MVGNDLLRASKEQEIMGQDIFRLVHLNIKVLNHVQEVIN